MTGGAAASPDGRARVAGHGVLGYPGRGEGKPVIAMLIHPKLVMQDLVGPMTVFNLMHSEMHLVWKKYEPVVSEIGVPLFPSTSFAECPKDVDILFVPGGLDGTIACLDDPEVLAFLADMGSRAKYVTSVCTGALLLGAAGLLKGYKATTLWNVHDQLAIYGATPVHERVVIDGNRMTGGGVTAGIDFGLTLAARIRSPEDAMRYQLIIEYAPDPPFNAGLPETAPKEAVERMLKGRAPVVDLAREKGEAIAAGWSS
ncbi:MAG: DJ-1/PfpI family protein [Sphingomonadaceae bacterium]|nr:DJ-1/PfpI family protein [Altererythrobacter sp.]MCP5393191.1 DJ-1/PfpI family protein [Sphingomonadaceae bacterium]